MLRYGYVWGFWFWRLLFGGETPPPVEGWTCQANPREWVACESPMQWEPEPLVWSLPSPNLWTVASGSTWRPESSERQMIAGDSIWECRASGREWMIFSPHTWSRESPNRWEQISPNAWEAAESRREFTGGRR